MCPLYPPNDGQQTCTVSLGASARFSFQGTPMSRSRKQTPIVAITTASSDKPYKVAEHRRERRSVKVSLDSGLEPEHPKAFGNPWRGEKDGKAYLDNPSAGDMRK